MSSWPLNGKKGGNRKHSKIDTLPPEMKATVEEMIMDGSATYSDIVTYLEQQGYSLSVSSVCRYPQFFAARKLKQSIVQSVVSGTGKGGTSARKPRRAGKTASTAGKGRSRPDAHRRHREPPPTHRSAEPPARALPEIIPDATGPQGWRHFILSCRIQYRKQEGRRWGQDSIKQKDG